MASLALPLAETGGTFIMGLLAAHDKRVKLAKEENAAVGQAIAALDHDVATIVAGFNNGDMLNQVAQDACIDVDKWFWSFITPYTQYQNVTQAMCPRNVFEPSDYEHKGGCVDAACSAVSGKTGGCYQSTPGGQGGGSCTAACDIGCNVVDAVLGNMVGALQELNGQPAGTKRTVYVCAIVGNKYGLSSRAAYDVTLVVPKVKNPEAEVTINKQTGIVTVGSQPSAQDVEIAKGVTEAGSLPDSGGDVIVHDAAGQDVTSTLVQPAGGTPSTIAGIPTKYLFIGGAIIIIVALLFGGSRQPTVIVSGGA